MSCSEVENLVNERFVMGAKLKSSKGIRLYWAMKKSRYIDWGRLNDVCTPD